MTSLSSPDVLATPSVSSKPDLTKPMSLQAILIFLAILALGLFFTAFSIYRDISTSGTKVTTILPFILLALALLIALGFEFVNGFHDTANAVATVIYTHSLPLPVAVVWSGLRIQAGFLAEARRRLGGVSGCTHLVELLGPLATTAIQTVVPMRLAAAGRTAAERPSQIGSCHALAPSGEVAAKYWPSFIGQSPAEH